MVYLTGVVGRCTLIQGGGASRRQQRLALARYGPSAAARYTPLPVRYAVRTVCVSYREGCRLHSPPYKIRHMRTVHISQGGLHLYLPCASGRCPLRVPLPSVPLPLPVSVPVPVPESAAGGAVEVEALKEASVPNHTRARTHAHAPSL